MSGAAGVLNVEINWHRVWGLPIGRIRRRVGLRCSGGRAPAVLGTASLASTDLGTAGAERGHQIRKELRILAATKDELGEQLSIIG